MAHDNTTQPTPQQGEIILYQPDETVRLEVRLEDDTVWLTQAQIVALFQKAKSTISFHISNIFIDNQQYQPITVIPCHHNHDRFLIIDDDVYLFGASLKDAGKKLFAYIKMDETTATDLLKGIR